LYVNSHTNISNVAQKALIVICHRYDHPLPGGHNFCLSSTSINKKPIFVSEVVTYEASPWLSLILILVPQSGHTR